MGKLTAAQKANVHFTNAVRIGREGGDPIAEYSLGLALAPTEWAFQNRGWLYFKRGEFAQAVADWERSGDEYALPLGRARLKIGDIDGAIASLERAQKKEDDDDVRGYLAEAYAAKLGKVPANAKPKTSVAKAAPYTAPARKRSESYDAYVARALEAAPLDPGTKDLIASLRRTAIFLTTTKTAPRDVGASRLGGLPDLPVGMPWPRAGKKPLGFVAQVRLDEVAKAGKTVLPRKGLLSFFVSEDEGSYLEKATVLHIDAKKLVPTEPPADYTRMVDGKRKRASYKPRAVAFSLASKLPSPSNAVFRKVKWKTGEKEVYETLYDATVDFSRHQLLGYRDRSYDAEQKATTALLFQCFSHGDMSWGDDDHLYFYLPEAALAAGDFSKVTPYSGE